MFTRGAHSDYKGGLRSTWRHTGKFGLLEIDQCDLLASDAGEACSDHSDCESVCESKDSVASESAASGVCFGRTVVLGTCLNYVEGGIAQGILCVD